MMVVSLSGMVAAAALPGKPSFKQGNEIVREVSTDEKLIALTFDDDPTPDETVQILDLLKEYDAKATFFIVGARAECHPDIVRREVAEGHEIANHTYSHLIWKPRTSLAQLRADIVRAQEAIIRISGTKPKLFRPVGGRYSKLLLNTVNAEGMRMVLWSRDQDTLDWNRPGVHKIVRNVLKHASNGDIILFHDHVHGTSDTIPALRRILPELKERGFRFVTVSELIGHWK